MLDTPVVLIFFNRPDPLRRVFAEVARARPRTLLLVADGPRPGHPGDVAACEASRAVVEQVDWDCRVLRNYSQDNLGCGLRPESGISWAFEQVDEAIILEDDCVPHPTFFRFASELLERYRNDERMMVVSGHHLEPGSRAIPYSYSFQRNLALWGWATWRRAWQHMDRSLTTWPELRETPWLLDILGDARQAALWSRYFEGAHEVGAAAAYWDTQWTYAVWSQNGLAAVPAQNLVSNIGFGPDATHTLSPNHRLADLPTAGLSFPLLHPPYLVRDATADRLIFDHVFSRTSDKKRLKKMLRRMRKLPQRLAARFREG